MKGLASKGTLFIFVGLTCLYGTETKVVLLDVNSDTTPASVRINLLGYEGVSDQLYEMTGQHKYITVPALPDSLNSETARDLQIKHIDPITVTSWLGHISNESTAQYYYKDHIVFTHTSYLSEILHNPSEESFSVGLSRESPLWNAHPEGVTYCAHTDTLHFAPSPLQSCLLDPVVTLDCDTTGPLRCHLPNSTLILNGNIVSDVNILISPFDYKIEMNKDVKECELLRSSYYNTSAIEVLLPNKKRINRNGKGMVPPMKGGTQLVDNVLKCQHEDYYLESKTAMMGLMSTKLSFVYKPKSGKLHIFNTRENSMRNSWLDVIIINLCLLTFVHWLSDKRKNFKKKWTIYPELIGIGASLAGLYFQKSSNGAYYRVADFNLGQSSIIALTWMVLTNIVAHIACIIVMLETEKSSKDAQDMYEKSNLLRKVSYEYSTLGSVYIQVVSGTFDMFDSYMAFLIGTTMVFNSCYNALDLYYKEKNSSVIIFISICAVFISSFAFYVTAAAPSVDPIAGLANNIYEASTLCLLSAITLATMSVTRPQ